MACICSLPKKKIFYAHIELYTRLADGMPVGSSPPSGTVKEVMVCVDCGAAEFTIPEGELRGFRAG
jgi:hypothetical protein